MNVPTEYRAARRVLLDALQALGSHLACVTIVGAQAIYLHVGDVDAGLSSAPTTTDGDLVLDVDILTPTPELSQALIAAGFTSADQPGTWRSAEGISVDLMVCPHQSGRTSPSARSAHLGAYGHPDRHTARIAAGLEPALVDHDVITLMALDPTDPRTVDVNVAGPSALIVAKLIKLEERIAAAESGGRSRVRGKDATDIFRLLVGTEPDALRTGFQRLEADTWAAAATSRARDFIRTETQAQSRSMLRRIFGTEVGDDELQLARWDALVDELIAAMASATE